MQKIHKKNFKIEIEKNKIISVFVWSSSDKNLIVSEIKKGVGNAFIFFDEIKNIEFLIDFIYSRNEFDEYTKEKTENWVVARSFKNKFIIFAPEKIEICTSHKKEEFKQIVCHETCHVLTQKINQNFSFWMFEGVALNVANQIKKGEIKKENIEYFIDECLFKNYNYKDFISHQGYLMSYLLIKYLIDNYDKNIIIELLKINYKTDKLIMDEFCRIMKKSNKEIIDTVKNIFENKKA